MKFTLSWLKEHLDTTASLGEIRDTLTMLGLEVEGITNAAETLKGFIVGYVVEAVQHPNADRLRVCKVDTGSGVVQVVCGAPNARTGMKGIFAPSGSTIPGTGLLLKASKIRGEIAGDAVHAQAIGAVGRHLDLDHRIVEAQSLGRRCAGRGLGRQVDDAAMVVAELEFA